MTILNHTLGFPRVGLRRELKKAQESYWAGNSTREELLAVGRELRARHWDQQKQAGIDLLPVGDFAWYDHVLTTSLLLGNVPARHQNKDGSVDIDTLFRIGRGRAPTGEPAAAAEMTKWFNTNYHYMVPEFVKGQQFKLTWTQLLDEVDEMLKQGFIDDAAELLGMTSPQRQVMLCSATLSEEVRKLGRKITVNPVLIDINPNEATVDTIKQICIKTTDEYRDRAVAALIDRYNPYLMIVFCFSKERANALGDVLGGMGYNVDVLTGELSQAKRKTVMKKFRDAKLQILVASDIAARGLDIEGVTHVVNYDIPHDVDWYVHRIGRTGRAGNDGIAVTLYTADEVKWLRNIETKLNIRMEKQNLEGKVIARREPAPAPKKKPSAPKRGKSAVADKRKAPKTGSNRRQKRK